MESSTAKRGSAHEVEYDHDERLSPADEQRRQMALRHVRQYPDPVLRVPADDVTSFDEELSALADRMSSIMTDAHGIGLAAPQLGLRLRMFVYQPESGPAEAVVNPTITWTGDETSVEDEGCLSLGDVRVPVERPTAIKVEGRNLAGDEQTWEFDDWYARVFQHEIDHLDGVLMIDRTTDQQRRGEAMSHLRPRP